MSPRVGVAAARREQVKQAALACLVENGYGNLSVKAIARRAGVSTGVLYHYFRNKDDILIQSLAAAFANSDRDLRVAVDQAAAGAERLQVYLRLAAALGPADPATSSVLLNGLGQVEYSPAIRGRLARLFADFRHYAREAVRGAQTATDPEPATVSQEARAALIVAVGLGLLCQWAVQPGSVDAHACGEELQSLFAAISRQGGPASV